MQCYCFSMFPAGKQWKNCENRLKIDWDIPVLSTHHHTALSCCLYTMYTRVLCSVYEPFTNWKSIFRPGVNPGWKYLATQRQPWYLVKEKHLLCTLHGKLIKVFVFYFLLIGRYITSAVKFSCAVSMARIPWFVVVCPRFRIRMERPRDSWFASSWII